MKQSKYGYARVSTRCQREDRQLVALAKMGIPRERIYVDKQSGKDFERERYQALLARLRPNPTIYFLLKVSIASDETTAKYSSNGVFSPKRRKSTSLSSTCRYSIHDEEKISLEPLLATSCYRSSPSSLKMNALIFSYASAKVSTPLDSAE